MTSCPVLALVTATPFVGACLIMLIGRTRPLGVRLIAVGAAAVTLGLSLYLYLAYDLTAGGYQFREQYPLVRALGISVELGADGMSVLMVLLTAIIITAGVLASWDVVHRRPGVLHPPAHADDRGVRRVHVLDLFLFFLFYEVAVLPMYLLIGIWGTGRKEYAAMKLTLYLMAGSALILAGILGLYFASGLHTFDLVAALPSGRLRPVFQKVFFPILFVGFGILAALWPLHTWSPDGHASAPTAVSMLHAGVLMKLGAYGCLLRADDAAARRCAILAADRGPAFRGQHRLRLLLGATAQKDLKYIVAYSSVSHMGIVMLGLAAMTETAISGAVLQMFSHGIMTGLFFALVGLIYEKSHTREIDRMGGFGRRMPGIAACFTLGGLSSLGLPGLAGFVAEILTFLGAWQSASRWWLFPAVLGTLLTAIYVLRVVKRIFWGPLAAGSHGEWAALPDARGPEWVSLVFLSAILILFGLVPGLALSRVDPAIVALLDRIGVLP